MNERTESRLQTSGRNKNLEDKIKNIAEQVLNYNSRNPH